MLLIAVAPLWAQTGPAGVGNSTNNVLWLKANSGTSTTVNGGAVSTWSDASGNANHAVQATTAKQPLYIANLINGMPGLYFDNSGTPNNDEMTVADNSNLDNTAGLTILTVCRAPSLDGSARAIISKRTGVGVDQSYTMFFYTSNHMFVDVENNDNRFQTVDPPFSGGLDYVITLLYDGSLAAASRSKLYINETLNITATETATAILDHASPVTIGTMNLTDGRPFGGNIAEVIIYCKALNTAERIIAHNYLLAKYGLTAAVNDIYAGDNPGNGNYDFDVAGVGTDATGSSTSVATSVGGGLGVTQVSGFDNGDYLIYGHLAGGNITQTTDIAGMTGTNPARWSRMYAVDITNTSTAQTVNLSFDISDSGGGVVTPATASNYVLLYRIAQSGSWTEVTTASSIAGDVINFNNVSIPADGYYTLGSRNYTVSPLPITLLNFAGELTEKGVELHWSTVNERNNDFFTIARSSNGDNFESLAVVNGSGSSSSENSYQAYDHEPFPGRTYYRLSQTDLDGTTTNLKTIVVYTSERSSSIEVIPNPSDGSFWFDLPSNVTEWAPSIINSAGREVMFTHSSLGSRVSVDARNLPKGLYVFKLISNRGIHTAKFVIE